MAFEGITNGFGWLARKAFGLGTLGAGAVGAAEVGRYVIDATHDEGDPLREKVDATMDNFNEKLGTGFEKLLDFSKMGKLIVPLITFLDKLMFGDKHVLGQMLTSFLPDHLFDPNDRAKLNGTSPADEWSRKFVREASEFKNWKDSAAVEKLENQAKAQGFTGTEFGHKGEPGDALRAAQEAGKLGFISSAEVHDMEKRPDVIAAGGVKKFVEKVVNLGRADDGHDLAVKLQKSAAAEAAIDAKIEERHGHLPGPKTGAVANPDSSNSKIASVSVPVDSTKSEPSKNEPIDASHRTLHREGKPDVVLASSGPDRVHQFSKNVMEVDQDFVGKVPNNRGRLEDLKVTHATFTDNTGKFIGSEDKFNGKVIPESIKGEIPETKKQKIGHTIGRITGVAGISTPN